MKTGSFEKLRSYTGDGKSVFAGGFPENFWQEFKIKLKAVS
jgi:hypothetical protein